MKTFQLTVLTEKDADKVMYVLSGLVIAGMISVVENVEIGATSNGAAPTGAAPTYDQVEEMIDESELSPYYSEQEVKNILHL